MSNEENPYQLKSKTKGPPKAVKGREWTPEEQREKLRDYILISKHEWEKIKYGTHIRYYTTEGEYRPGGFVLSNPFNYKPRGESKEVMALKLQNNLNKKAPGYTSWIAPYESIRDLYVKMDAASIALRDLLEETLRDTVGKLNANIRTLAEHYAKLAQRVEALERNQKR